MKLRMILSAFFKMSNLGLLVLFCCLSAIVRTIGANYFGYNSNSPLPYIPAAFLYLVIVGQTLYSKKFHEQFNRKEKVRTIQNLNYSCLKLANEAKKSTNSTYLQRLRKVMEEKSDIVNSFFKGEHSFVKERIVEQTLNLVIVYIKLLTNFCIRSRELSEMDLSKVSERISSNTRRLNFMKDVHIAEDIKNLISMDEKMINRVKDEKKDLERISAKLDYIESTINMFKHQILTSLESGEMLEKLQTAVNEATALDNVLEDRRRSKLRY
jgi:hypothetical protein